MATLAVRDGVGGMIAGWRKARRLSQLALAGDSGISARHLSFLESGRSRPSREMVLRLCETLEVPLRARNDFLLAAGYAPLFRESDFEAPEMEEALAALRLILGQHDPLPAVAMDTRWNYIMVNRAYAGFVALLDPAVLPGGSPVPLDLIRQPRPNQLRLLCQPGGYRRVIANWAAVVPVMLARVAAEVHNDADEERRALLAECLSCPGVPALGRGPEAAAASGQLIIPVEIGQGADRIRMFSTVATLGTAQDITLRDLRIEMFHPASPGDLKRILARAGG